MCNKFPKYMNLNVKFCHKPRKHKASRHFIQYNKCIHTSLSIYNMITSSIEYQIELSNANAACNNRSVHSS